MIGFFTHQERNALSKAFYRVLSQFYSFHSESPVQVPRARLARFLVNSSWDSTVVSVQELQVVSLNSHLNQLTTAIYSVYLKHVLTAYNLIAVTCADVSRSTSPVVRNL
jgi:hypothetical protein